MPPFSLKLAVTTAIYAPPRAIPGGLSRRQTARATGDPRGALPKEGVECRLPGDRDDGEAIHNAFLDRRFREDRD
jgi:hypothetical protein